MKIALIGQGKLARHLSYLLRLNHQSFVQFGREHTLSSLKSFDLILLAVNDTAIKTIFEEYQAKLQDKTWIHFSGAFYHHEILGLHPLMSFSTKLFDPSFYQKIRWVLDHETDLAHIFGIDFKQVSFISQEKKAHYHALCVLAGNIPHLIWKEVETQMQDLNIPALDFKTYIQKVSENFLSSLAPTGPIVRKDQETIQSNLKSLNSLEQNIYQNTMELYYEKH